MAKGQMKKAELVFIPIPGVSHITSAMEVSKLITDLYDHFSVTVLIIRPPGDTKPIPESSNPRVRFLELRNEQSSQEPVSADHSSFIQLINGHKAHLREILAGIISSGSSSLAGIVIDMFCSSMIDVANEFRIPSYLLYTSGAAFLGLLFHLQSLRDDFDVVVAEAYQDPEAEIVVPTFVNPAPAKILPRVIVEKGGNVFLDHARKYRETKGILINTFQELESHAIQALSNDGTIPPVFPIGPILKLNGKSSDKSGESEVILNWLDLQPDSSVVFLCFGSMGTFGIEQVKEIASALEQTGCRFLWSLRKPLPKVMVGYCPENYENLEEVLPEGFLQRTSEVGKVIGWAPQVAVLSHPAVGGFVSHCGWNSILESVWCGVPIASWPLYAEQQANSFLLIKDLGLAAEIKMDYVMRFGSETGDSGDAVVGADVIGKGIKEVMDPGNGIRKKMMEMKENSRLAISENGSSSASLKCFLKNVMDNMNIP